MCIYNYLSLMADCHETVAARMQPTATMPPSVNMKAAAQNQGLAFRRLSSLSVNALITLY
jgi:hypothetical protein